MMDAAAHELTEDDLSMDCSETRTASQPVRFCQRRIADVSRKTGFESADRADRSVEGDRSESLGRLDISIKAMGTGGVRKCAASKAFLSVIANMSDRMMATSGYFRCRTLRRYGRRVH